VTRTEAAPGVDLSASPSPRVDFLVFFLVAAIALPIVLGLGMTKGLSHDEHQHVAAGALIAREGLMPYRDFPHFHTPYLACVYAGIFRFCDHLLLSARMVSVLSATGILAVIGSVAFGLFRERGRRTAALVCAGSVILALTTRLFTETSGYAWNHEPALFLALLAFVVHVAGIRANRAGWFIASGMLMGLAIGTRITYAPLVAPFGLALLLYPGPIRWDWRRVFAFSGGILFGLSGVIYLFATVPEQALYDNFGFAKTNVVYRFSTGEPRTMTLPTKLRFFWKLIVRPDAALFLVGALSTLAAFLAMRGTQQRVVWQLRFLGLLLPFLLIGSFAPSPLFDQYFYPLVPFVVLAALYAIASILPGTVWFSRTLLMAGAAVLLSVAMGVEGFEELNHFVKVRKWHGMKLHEEAEAIRARIPSGRILTLAPINPLEAGLSIYPSFCTGPIAWRVSPYIESAKAARLKITSPATLESLLAADPPAGVLVGFEKTGEEQLSEYAERYRYEPFAMDDEQQLWIRPAK